jgi:bifunctional oligoribonuclease and PAP phosphatase NrnA
MNSLFQFFRQYQRFVLTTHVNPDGDAIGCEMALGLWLQEQGKTVQIINHSTTPFVYRFLDPDTTIRVFDPAVDAATLHGVDAIVLLDTNHVSRVASMEPYVRTSPAQKACIDHHLDPEPFADVALIRPEATSTGEILYNLFRASGDGSISPEIARALYVAILTDTGSFRFPRVSAATHRMTAHLIECGADPVDLYNQVYNRWSPGRLRLLGEMLSHLETAYDGRLVYVTVTQEMLRRTGTLEEDTDNFTSYLMSMDGVLAGMFFLELAQGFKISFRSHGDIPVNELAREFGGNGHKNAAGARFNDGTMDEILSSVIAAAGKYVHDNKVSPR